MGKWDPLLTTTEVEVRWLMNLVAAYIIVRF